MIYRLPDSEYLFIGVSLLQNAINEKLLSNTAYVASEYINDNTIDHNLVTGTTKKGKLKIHYETIDTVSDILTNKFLDYFRNGGDITNLTPSAIYSRTKKQ